ncbi:hypothetical protein GE09DRAFT_557127 [Coniochaeta sp. 2T2.1]|nr:hypothetical protein GE09DRAFT_557127 [Coniochaeta sp. 2T2.1]
MSDLSPDGQAALNVCKKLLDSLKSLNPQGRAQFVSTLAPGGQVCHARTSLDPSVKPQQRISYEKNQEDFPNRIPWESKTDTYEEGIDDGPGGRQVVVLVDHDIAMVWTPYWVKHNEKLQSIGTNCFTLVKHLKDGLGPDGEWLLVGMTDTGRPLTEEDRKRLE